MIFERGFFNNYKDASNRITLNESTQRTRKFSSTTIKSAAGTTVFISHSHDDLDIGELDGILGMLKKYNIVPFIDSMDEKMPPITCADTAKRIKEVISFCEKFILLATDKAIESFWCNWEVGIGDVYKFRDHIAILPMKEKNESNENYKGNEYLNLYSSIEYFNGTTKYSSGQLIQAGYYVRTPMSENYTIETLENWLNNRR